MKLLNFYKQIFTLFKTKSTILFQVIGAFLLPIKWLIVLVILMILIDMITGIWKSKKQGIPITSNKLSHTVSKILLYCGALIVVYGLDVALLGEFVAIFTTIKLFLTKGLACFLVTVEIVSFHENFEVITGVNLFSKFKEYLTRAKQIKDDIQDVAKKD